MSNVVLRRTKILATLGPATESDEILDQLVKAGVDVVRLNFSHGSPEEHIKRAQKIRAMAKANGRFVGVLVDLQGPKIRTQRFKNGSVKLATDDDFCLDANLGSNDGDGTQVGITYPQLPNDVKKNDVLVLDDGRIILKVKTVKAVAKLTKQIETP